MEAVGVEHFHSDVEVISMAHAFLKELGIEEKVLVCMLMLHYW